MSIPFFNGKAVEVYTANAPVTPTNPFPVTGGTTASFPISPFAGTLTDRSGSASVTSTQIMAANSSRKYLFIQNLDDTISIYVNFGATATTGAGSYLIVGGASLSMESSFISTQAVNLRSASGTPAFTAKEGS